MKTLNNFIVERLHINKDSKTGIDLDNLVNQNITLYDDIKIDVDDDMDDLQIVDDEELSERRRHC